MKETSYIVYTRVGADIPQYKLIFVDFGGSPKWA